MSKATNYWRRQLIKEIQKCGEYCRSLQDNYPIEWTVYCCPTLDATTIRKSLVDLGHFQNEADLTLQFPEFDEWFEDNWGDGGSATGLYHQGSLVQECVVSDLHDEGLRMWSPTNAASVLMPYTGKGADSAFECTLHAYGRGGKHVCLVEFEGHKLEGLNQSELINYIEDMSEKGGGPDWIMSNTTVRQLLGMLREWSTILTTEVAERNALYYATDRVMQDLNETWG